MIQKSVLPHCCSLCFFLRKNIEPTMFLRSAICVCEWVHVFIVELLCTALCLVSLARKVHTWHMQSIYQTVSWNPLLFLNEHIWMFTQMYNGTVIARRQQIGWSQPQILLKAEVLKICCISLNQLAKFCQFDSKQFTVATAFHEHTRQISENLTQWALPLYVKILQHFLMSYVMEHFK